MKQILLRVVLIFSINFVYSQTANQPPDIQICDDNNDGISNFDLTSNDAIILGVQNPNDFFVTYHISISDADNGLNPIANPNSFFNTSNPQQIFARVTLGSNGGHDITSFIIEVLPIPSINNPTPLEVCDDDLDGFTVFDLESKNTEILNNPSSIAIAYYETLLDAQSQVYQIANPSYYISNIRTIYVRVQNSITYCSVITSLDLIALDCTDSDSDGVIDSDEDLNSNGNLDDDDTDMDSIANYLDDDDDGDNVPTITEINISLGRSSNQLHSFIDTDSDLIENYLDDDDDGDGVFTIDEDYNGNGDPTDDDTNNSGFPDYLEMSVALSSDDFKFENIRVYPNPSNSIVYLDNLTDESNISIYDIRGRRINMVIQKHSNSRFRFNVSSLNNGIYVIKIEDNNKEKKLKFVVEK